MTGFSPFAGANGKCILYSINNIDFNEQFEGVPESYAVLKHLIPKMLNPDEGERCSLEYIADIVNI